MGTYTWAVSFAGDGLNDPANDQGGPAEQVTTVNASPTLVTTASFSAGNVVGSAIPQDSAVLSGGYQESGALVFQLHAPDNSIVDTETVTSSGDGTYSTSNVNVATQVGTYTWAVSFAGDGLNNSASDQGGAGEQVTTVKASPSISTSASETAGGVVGSATLSDSVTVSGGDNPTGTVTFTLTAPNGTTSPVGTVSVAGDGTLQRADSAGHAGRHLHLARQLRRGWLEQRRRRQRQSMNRSRQSRPARRSAPLPQRAGRSAA